MPWKPTGLSIPHCLDNQHTNGGKVVSLTRRPQSTHQKQILSASGTHFCYSLSKHQGVVRVVGLIKLKNLMTSSGLESGTFRLVAYCFNQLRYRVSQNNNFS
jgi:hypothetical protein